MTKCAYCKKRIGLFELYYLRGGYPYGDIRVHSYCVNDWDYQEAKRKNELSKLHKK